MSDGSSQDFPRGEPSRRRGSNTVFSGFWNYRDQDDIEEETDVELGLVVEVKEGQLVFSEPERIN